MIDLHWKRDLIHYYIYSKDYFVQIGKCREIVAYNRINWFLL